MKYLWMAATALAVLSPIAAFGQAPSLADVARMNRAAQRPKKVPTLVIDDDAMIVSGRATKTMPGRGPDNPGTQQPAQSSAQPPAVPGQEGPMPVPGNKVSAARSEDECARLKKELEDLRVHQQGWKLAAAKYQEMLATETSEFRRTMYQDALENDRRNVSFYQQKISDAEAKLAEAEAAKSGASATTVPQ